MKESSFLQFINIEKVSTIGLLIIAIIILYKLWLKQSDKIEEQRKLRDEEHDRKYTKLEEQNKLRDIEDKSRYEKLENKLENAEKRSIEDRHDYDKNVNEFKTITIDFKNTVAENAKALESFKETIKYEITKVKDEVLMMVREER